nr:hypothetical protein [Ruminococcus albus]
MISLCVTGYTYKPFGAHMKPDYAVFVEGTDEVAAKYASILAITLSSIKQYYDEKYDKNNFIKNVVLDNVLPGDVHVKARELHFSSDISRVGSAYKDRFFKRCFLHTMLSRTCSPTRQGFCLQYNRERHRTGKGSCRRC